MNVLVAGKKEAQTSIPIIHRGEHSEVRERERERDKFKRIKIAFYIDALDVHVDY